MATTNKTKKGKEGIIKRPRISEKAAFVSTKNVYTFDVSPDATKPEIIKNIVAKYKVTPVKVGIVTIRKNKITVRGKRGTTSGGKKAYVYLKKGDSIELI
ncbi:MAG: 50S ribosomal protein L23 [Candidatus Pacebacteria bacterium]|nr:50S ribosomal protein L23 [Candidatus Paceibacterota bacterium]MBP9772653.1 50S ribosomal protein L23 [Candidatus Paceibacterota bacterium]QQR76262.1 MAG: 50S ribosomal protein L23 [Candidatus Nomurabacteria bacterium]